MATISRLSATVTPACTAIVRIIVAATLILTVAVQTGVTVADSLLIVAIASVIAAWLGWRLHRACD